MFNKKNKEELPYRVLKTSDLLRRYLLSKLPNQRVPLEDFYKQINKPQIPDSEINHLAIIIDGTVEDVMRAQNQLAALLLSSPEFVEFNPQNERLFLGKTKYSNGEFLNDFEE